MSSRLPLDGVRVADFTWVGAGPFLTKPLADHGADVIKIESRTRTDPIRSMAPFRDGHPGVNRSGYFANRNTSKRSICLDLKDTRGKDLALELIAHSDIVASNFTPGTMDRLGLGYKDVLEVRPDVIYLEMPMQGNAGPHRDFRGYGLTIAAAGGLLGLTGHPCRPPVGTGTNYPDHVPNPLHAAVAVLAALRRRRRTGESQYIELAQLESTTNVIGPAILAAAAGISTERSANQDPVASPHGVYPCQGEDRWCAVAVTTDSQWAALVRILGNPPWAANPAYATAAGRQAAHQALDEHVATTTAGRHADELADALCAAGVPAAAVSDAAQVLADDQLNARDHWKMLDHPEMGHSVYDNIPYRLSATPGHLQGPAPVLGADTREVCLGLLELTPDEYEHLAAQGVVG
ncbi:CaiB/BaiF CoA transferase family protein [Streptomyces sp. NPDC127168]|uniref:CaiB/BaiF CoA transferase family protein n=1 Tax=unclassified Streptomyces TaxID=2593676 RepID=UPI00362D6A49